MLLVVPGCFVLQSSVSCGDVVRQTLLSSGSEFLGSAAQTLISEAISAALGVDTTDSTE